MSQQQRLSHQELEDAQQLVLDFDKLEKVAACGQPLVPVAVQEVASGEVLLIGYANQEALDYSLAHRVAAFWSTSRNELWIKGATSGDYLDVEEVRVNCEQNSLLYRVRRRGAGACHTRGDDGRARPGCYYRRVVDGSLEFLSASVDREG